MMMMMRKGFVELLLSSSLFVVAACAFVVSSDGRVEFENNIHTPTHNTIFERRVKKIELWVVAVVGRRQL
jgi:hypothetical protein